jgi:hypothetical protein
MTAAVKKIKDLRIEFDEKRILKLIGYRKKSQKPNEPVTKLIQEEKKKLHGLLQPEAIYTVIGYDETNKHPVFNHAEKVALCLCTIGAKLEEEVENLMKKNELLRALILDALGSEAVEEVAIQSDRILAERAREMNLWPSKRFSPGYGNWDIREQRFIFGLLPAHEIGVSLKESCMMIPRKSISFRINFYREKQLSTRRKN